MRIARAQTEDPHVAAGSRVAQPRHLRPLGQLIDPARLRKQDLVPYLTQMLGREDVLVGSTNRSTS